MTTLENPAALWYISHVCEWFLRDMDCLRPELQQKSCSQTCQRRNELQDTTVACHLIAVIKMKRKTALDYKPWTSVRNGQWTGFWQLL